MPDVKQKKDFIRPISIQHIDPKEFELPETIYINDIDTKVIQGIVLECLSKVSDVSVPEGTFIDSILGRSGPEVGSGKSEKDTPAHSVSIKMELNIAYGVSIPAKAEEIQTKIVEEITHLTGLRVASIHIVFKDIISARQLKTRSEKTASESTHMADFYNDNF